MTPSLLAIDQGTTSTRAMVFSTGGEVLARAQVELPQIFPAPGWVEHDPETIWAHTLNVCREALATPGIGRIAALGITNQRETTLVWDRATGRPVYHAIVWQDRRTAQLCEALSTPEAQALVAERTGLVLDPYFSASKIRWLLDTVPGVRERADRGELAVGTVDSFLLWRLTEGRVHATDATNAARTLLFDIRRQCWDDELLSLFGIPASLSPHVRHNPGDVGPTRLFGNPIPITGLAAHQQAHPVGQACAPPGSVQ